MKIQYQSSVMFVKDIAASRNFYETLLGQEVEVDFGPNVGFKGGFAIWQVEHATEMIFAEPPNENSPLGRKNFEIYFEAPDVESVWQQLIAADVVPVHSQREQPWGQRVFRVYDPDGHIVEVGEPMNVVVRRFLDEGLSFETVAEKTFMPLEIVKQMGAG